MEHQPTVKLHLEQLQRYCAYRDRCHSEVEKKMNDLEIFDEEERFFLVRSLVEDQFLDEQRFANAYVRGYLRTKRWGRKKITQGLQQKQVSEFCIKKAMELELDQEIYTNNIWDLASRKVGTIQRSTSDKFQRREKLQRFLMGKGYTFNEIQEALEEYTPLTN